ncbi:hypothetical protein Q5752_006950 [Cryptotrichosporon argae]
MTIVTEHTTETIEPAWLTELKTEGFVVIPSVLAREVAEAYADRAYQWVEDFGLGYKRHDKNTHNAEHLHYFLRGGLTNRYGVAHEQFVWDVKQEPAVVGVFERIWDTNELIVAFDGINISIPINGRQADDDVFKPWAHVDQSPHDRHLHCVQGIVNLNPNGPNDGGLMVLKGSAALFGQLFDAFEDRKPAEGWNTIDRHDHTEDQLQWLYARGCEWHKVCAEPGDLLLWDSRTVHYGATPSALTDRVAIYVCYKPAKFADAKAMARFRDAFERKINMSHDPVSFIAGMRDVPESHPTYEILKARPLQEPVLSARGRQLAGLDPY